jgi:lysophospholipase L1-like esterase
MKFTNEVKKRSRSLILKVVGVMTFVMLNTGGNIVCAQTDVQAEKFPFIKYDQSRIEFPGDSSAFVSLFRKMRVLHETGFGSINIVHVGGSHVQADFWTGKIRENFNGFFSQKESARGIIFPYRAVKTNGSVQFDVVTSKPWEGYRCVRLQQPADMGLMGWDATARDSGQTMEITFKGDTISSFYFDFLRIFHHQNDSVFRFTVQSGDSVYQPVYADSCRCSVVELKEKSNRFLLTVHRTDSVQNYFTLQGIQTQLHKPLIAYHSVGVNGASVSSFLNCNLLAGQIQYLHPDLVVFSIGINDSFDKDFTREVFERNYSELVKRIRQVNPDVAFLFITNTDSYKRVKKQVYKNMNGKKVRESMFALAEVHGAAVWDMYTVMGGLGSIATWRRNGLAQRDLIHLTNRGYRVMGDLFFEAFITKYKASEPLP